MKKLLALTLCALLLVPMIAVASAADLAPVTYRWDFNDLSEKNGLNPLIPNELSSANEDLAEFNDGIISVLAHGSSGAVDYELTTPIVLTDANDWSIEWCGALADYSILFGSDSKESLIYLAAGVGQWGNPIRIIPDGTESPIFVDDTGKGISYGDYLDAAYEMNTWRITYTAKDMSVAVEILNGDKWEEVGSAVTDQEYTITLTRMFGRYATNPFANFCGDLDYVEVKCYAEAAQAPVTEDTTPATEDTTPVTEDTTPVTEDTTPVTEDEPTETPDAPPTADIAVVLAAVAAIATSGAIILKKKH